MANKLERLKFGIHLIELTHKTAGAYQFNDFLNLI